MKIAHESSNETDHNPRNNESNIKLNNLADILDYEDSYSKKLKTAQVNFLEIEDLGIKEQENESVPLEEFNRLKETNQTILEKQKITANKKEDLE